MRDGGSDARVWIAGFVLALAGSGDEERGLKLLEAGQFAEAATAFRAAIAARGASAELCYNLALALWQAGDLDAAETAAEQAATLSDGRLAPLRDGILGNLRYSRAKAQEAEDPKAALQLAEQARDHYVRGASRPGAPPPLVRNLERTLQLIDALQKKIDEQEKQEQDQQQDQQQDQSGEQQDDKQKSEEQKSEEQKEQEKSEKSEEQQQQQQQQQQGEQEQKEQQQKNEPSEPSGEPQPEPSKPEEPKEPEPAPSGSEQQQEQPPAPGEQAEGRELTPEEKKRLLDKLEQMQAELRALRAQQHAKRPKVKRDW